MTMTTKPKTRKAPAKRAVPKAATKQASGEPKRAISEICRLVTRWRFLEAEEDYQATIAKTDEECNDLIGQHRDEQDEIEMELSRLIPQDFDEVRELLEHAIKLMDGGLLTNGADVMMLKEHFGIAAQRIWQYKGGRPPRRSGENAWPSRPHPRECVPEHGQFYVARMTLRLRYRTWKLRALCWVLRRLRAGQADWLAGRRLLEMSEPMDTEIEIRGGSPEAE